MKAPLISIIIPVWNAGKTLADCLISIEQQKFRDFEVLIIDNLSTDNTSEIVRKYAASGNIKWTPEKDKGIYDAMNKGITLSRGTWVYFLGSDDILINDESLSLVSQQLTDDRDIFYGDTIWIPENFNDSGIKDITLLLRDGINHQRVFYRKSLFEKYGTFNIDYTMAADYAMNIRFFCDPEIRKKYKSIPIAFYHTGGRSATTIDVAFWHDWRTTIYKSFVPYLPKKIIYRRLSWYCWYLMEQKKYAKAFSLFCAIFFHTLSFTFFKHTVSQALKMRHHSS